MKKDFTQPLEISDTTGASLFIEIVTDSPNRVFVVTKADEELLEDEYIPLTCELVANTEPVLQIIKFLRSKGLSVISCRELAKEQEATYSFVDDTPGTLDTHICYHIKADMFESQDDLNYVEIEELREHINYASFASELEKVAANTLWYQLMG